MTSSTLPLAVIDWVNSHKGSRKAAHIKGAFDRYANSLTSDCWGQPKGGFDIGQYKIAVCQPTPKHCEDTAFFYFDYILKE